MLIEATLLVGGAISGQILKALYMKHITTQAVQELKKAANPKPQIVGYSQNLVDKIKCKKCGAKANHAYHLDDGSVLCSTGCNE